MGVMGGGSLLKGRGALLLGRGGTRVEHLTTGSGVLAAGVGHAGHTTALPGWSRETIWGGGGGGGGCTGSILQAQGGGSQGEILLWVPERNIVTAMVNFAHYPKSSLQSAREQSTCNPSGLEGNEMSARF